MNHRRDARLEPDPVIEAYQKDIDRTLIRENLKLTVEQRFCGVARGTGQRGRSGVQFIIVGGAAATAHGSARLTAGLAPYQPYARGAPPGLPFQWDERTLTRDLNFTLTTALGDLDLLGEITGGGTYDDLLPHTAVLRPFGIECRCLALKRLIEVKRAAGRPRDREAIAELEAILEESGGSQAGRPSLASACGPAGMRQQG